MIFEGVVDFFKETIFDSSILSLTCPSANTGQFDVASCEVGIGNEIGGGCLFTHGIDEDGVDDVGRDLLYRSVVLGIREGESYSRRVGNGACCDGDF